MARRGERYAPPVVAAYSERFYANVTGVTDMQRLVVEWMRVQAPLLQRPMSEILTDIDEWVGDGLAAGVLKGVYVALEALRALGPRVLRQLCEADPRVHADACVTAIDELASALNLASEFQGSWALFVSRMLELADPAMASRPATLRARVGGLRAPELRFQLANLTASTVNGAGVFRELMRLKPKLGRYVEGISGPANSWRLNAAGQPAPYLTAPLMWAIPGTLREQPDPRAAAAAGWRTSAAVRSFGALSALEPPGAEYVEEESVPLLGGKAPPLWLVTAMSSAFAAFAGSLNLTKAVLGELMEHTMPDSPPDELIASDLSAIGRAAHELMAAARAQPGRSAACTRVLDETCAAITVWNFFPCIFQVVGECAVSSLAYLADLAPCAKAHLPLRFDERTCPFPRARLADGGYADGVATAQTVGALQRAAGTGRKIRLVLTGNVDCDVPAGCVNEAIAKLFTDPPFARSWTTPSQRVFAASWAQVVVAPLAGTNFTQAAVLKTHTVANAAFDVSAGTPVDLLILSNNAPIPLTIGLSTNATQIAGLGAYARDATADAVVQYVKSWLNATARPD